MTAQRSDWDLAVVGAGIAGLTAARTAATHGLRTVAFDRLAPGGELINLGVLRHYPGLPATTTGPDLAGSLLEAATVDGVEIAYSEVTALNPGPPAELRTAEGPHTARAVVVATGLSPGRLDLPDTSRWVGRGLSQCASCDGPLFAGRRVVVVGDDEWAAQEAAELSGIAAHVTVLVPGLPGWSDELGGRLAQAGVEVRLDTAVAGLSGDAALSAVHLDDGAEVAADGVFVHTGRRPRTLLLAAAGLGCTAAAAAGDPPHVFVAGDVRRAVPPYAVAAAADGLRAGLAAASLLLSP